MQCNQLLKMTIERLFLSTIVGGGRFSTINDACLVVTAYVSVLSVNTTNNAFRFWQTNTEWMPSRE